MSKLYTKKQMEEWHNEVCSRDGYICCGCMKDFSSECFFNEQGRNQYVCGDHIKTKGAHPELVLYTNNGRCVCYPCHELIGRGWTISKLNKR